MDEKTAVITSNYVLAGCALIALLLIVPAASAAANRLQPGWRAWVFPLAFFSLLACGILNIVSLQGQLGSYSVLLKLATLATGLSLHFFVLNALYRALIEKAWRLALAVWAVFILFAVAVFFVDSVLVLTFYESACAAVLFALYGSVYVREQEKASDVLPIFIGTVIIVLAVIVNAVSFSLSFGFITINQAFTYYFLQAIAVFFFLKGGFHFYNIKYAEQRNMERILLTNSE
jgi:hypothetical protein